MDLVDKEVVWVEESVLPSPGVLCVVLMGRRADRRGAGVPKGFLCQRGWLGPGLRHGHTPSLLPPSQGAGLLGHCSCNLENNFPLVGYCGLPYLEQSC